MIQTSQYFTAIITYSQLNRGSQYSNNFFFLSPLIVILVGGEGCQPQVKEHYCGASATVTSSPKHASIVHHQGFVLSHADFHPQGLASPPRPSQLVQEAKCVESNTNFAHSRMALDRSINSSEPRLYHPLNEGYSNTLPSLLGRIKEVIHRKCLAWKSGRPRDGVCVHCHHWEKASIRKINLQCFSRPSPGRPSSLCCSIIHPHIHLSKEISLPLIKMSSKSDKMLHA